MASGIIYPKDISDIVFSLFTMMGIYVPGEIIEERSKEMLAIIAVNQDGEISKDKYLKDVLSCDTVCDLVQVLDDEDDNCCFILS